MSRPRSPNRDKAYEIYKKFNGRITSKEIATLLNENENNINCWRTQDKWRRRFNKVGAPYGNKNAIGNKGGAPKGNINSFKIGNYTKRIPFAVKTIMEELDVPDPIEKLWKSICLQEARIIYMQNIMHVESKEDTTKELKKTSNGEKMWSEEYEIQFAWDKEANLMNTQSKAMNTLAKLIKQYVDMVNANWDLATEEQKLRIQGLKNKVDNPEFKHKVEVDKEKLRLENERFEHQKKVDESKNW
ncbi:phage terminase small subunit [Clostridium puniceum]|uniref:Phage terminase small subunit n=1 Tax=Clostridium puniceum TaxID=29367 RepID=A0A1S8TVM3_9CLOT|nr:phage terminase small subunit [Clostridium puniceum]OOM81776.1 phage terminase small subunit [Clostridium puniceum]